MEFGDGSLPTRVAGGEELIGVVPTVAAPAERFGDGEFEVERGRLSVGGCRRYCALEATSASGGHFVLDLQKKKKIEGKGSLIRFMGLYLFR